MSAGQRNGFTGVTTKGMGGDWEFVRRVGVARFIWRNLDWLVTARLLRRRKALVLATGTEMPLPRDFAHSNEVYVTEGCLDWGSEQLLVQHLDAGGCFLDIGAHLGYYSLLTSARVREVFAYEPNPRVREALRRNLAGVGNVTVIGSPVSDDARDMGFVLEREPSLSHLTENLNGKAWVLMRTVTLDDLVASRSELKVTGIKIDAEGYDLKVLLGARRIVERDQPLILTEFNLDMGVNRADSLFAFAGSYGYGVFAYVERLDGLGLRPRQILPLSESSLSHARFQMLFLVPRRLQPAFVERVAAQPVANDTRASVRARLWESLFGVESLDVDR